EIGERAELRVDVTVVVHVVAAVRERGRVERAEPDRVDAERGQVRHPGDDSLEVAEAVTVGVGEAAGVYLVNHRLPPPVGAGGGPVRWRHLIEPRMMPLTTQRWPIRKATRVGSRAIRYDAKATL